MVKDVVGSIRKLVLDGTSFDVKADANITQKMSKYEKEAVPSSGRSMIKMTKISPDRESVTVITNGAEADLLKELAERTADFPISYETAAGDTYRITGQINLEQVETEEGVASITLIPRDDWTSFIAT